MRTLREFMKQLEKGQLTTEEVMIARDLIRIGDPNVLNQVSIGDIQSGKFRLYKNDKAICDIVKENNHYTIVMEKEVNESKRVDTWIKQYI